MNTKNGRAVMERLESEEKHRVCLVAFRTHRRHGLWLTRNVIDRK